jgi:hypothetical protein
MAVDITALYCCLDDFCKVFEDWEAHRLIPPQTTRQRTGKLSRSEMLFIMVLFHLSPFKHMPISKTLPSAAPMTRCRNGKSCFWRIARWVKRGMT